MYEQLKDQNFEIIAVAEDTAGEAAAGRFYDAAKATFTTLIDTRHTVSSLYGMVNVPTGVMIDEQGRVVRQDEGTYTRTYQAGQLTFGTDEYVPAVRDWVAHGAESRFALDRKALTSRLRRPSSQEALADAHFRLASYFVDHGQTQLAENHWSAAQRLNPDSWNYSRQDWSFTPTEAGTNWLKKFQTLEGKPYYAPMDLPKGEGR